MMVRPWRGLGLNPLVASLLKYTAVLVLCLAVFAGSGSFVGTSTVSIIQSAPTSPVRQPQPAPQISVPDTPVLESPTAVAVAPQPDSPMQQEALAPAQLDVAALSPPAEPEAEISMEPAVETAAVERARVTSGVNLRADGVSGSAVLGVLRRGEEVEIVGRNGGWVQVARNGAIIGWVWGDYLGPSSATDQPVEVVELGTQVVAQSTSSGSSRSSVMVIETDTLDSEPAQASLGNASSLTR